MPTVVLTRPTATQNSPFLPQRWPKQLPVLTAHLTEYRSFQRWQVLTAQTHGGMARLSEPEWPGKYRDGRLDCIWNIDTRHWEH